MNNLVKNVAIWMVIALVLMTVFNQFSTRQAIQKAMEYSQFIEEVKQGRIAKVTIEGRVLKGMKTTGERFTSYSPGDAWLVSDLLKNGVIIEAKPEEDPHADQEQHREPRHEDVHQQRRFFFRLGLDDHAVF